MPQGIDGEGHFPQHPFGVWVKMMPLFLRDVREAVPYIRPLEQLCKYDAFAQPSQSPAVTAPPKGEPRLYSY